jgi:hypothetical protein
MNFSYYDINNYRQRDVVTHRLHPNAHLASRRVELRWIRNALHIASQNLVRGPRARSGIEDVVGRRATSEMVAKPI